MSTSARVGVVVLTYNSASDLPACLDGLFRQRGADIRIIVVDNASIPENRTAMEATFLEHAPDGPVIDAAAASPTMIENNRAVFIRNSRNAGYSAGNNIGARLAVGAGCEAILIVNPDVRIDDPDYVTRLAELIVADPKTAVACSRLTNLSGAQENPMTEPGFVEELFWPVKMLIAGLLRFRPSVVPLSGRPIRVQKVSGACFLIRTDFLQQIGFFDESVFLYCEESILQAQVRATGWHMIMDPELHALHAHRVSTKGNPLSRFQAWADSRRQFHKAYGGYGKIRQSMLAGSRRLMLMLVQSRAFLQRLWSRSNRSGVS